MAQKECDLPLCTYADYCYLHVKSSQYILIIPHRAIHRNTEGYFFMHLKRASKQLQSITVDNNFIKSAIQKRWYDASTFLDLNILSILRASGKTPGVVVVGGGGV